MRPSEPRPDESGARQPSHAQILAKLDSFDVVTERAAISVLKLAGWIATVGVALYGLWKSF